MKPASLLFSGALLAAFCLTANVRGDNQSSFVPATSTRAVLYAQADAQVTDSSKRAQVERDRLVDEIKSYKTEFGRTVPVLPPPGFPITITGSAPKRALVIPATEPDAKNLTAAEEDLNVMGHILEKALNQTGEDENAGSAMGIKLAGLMGQSGGTKYLQLEGYGAVFMLNVNFPLAGPPNKAEETDTNAPVNSAWEEAKHELYGQPANGIRPPPARVDYDPQRVEKLKNALLGALKNASNMRALKPDESVTVVVTSGGNGRGAASLAYTYGQTLSPSLPGSGGGGGGGDIGGAGGVVISRDPETMKKQYTVSGASGGGGTSRVATAKSAGNTDGSTLTIRAKKADIDAFAKGKLNLPEFRNKATLLVY